MTQSKSSADVGERRIRVLFAIGSLGGGGSERQLLGMLQRLDRTRFEPFLYLIHDGGELQEQTPADVPVHVFWRDRSPPRWNWPGRIHRWQVADLRRLLDRWQIDCVYDRNFHTTLVTAPATAGQVPRISTVVSDPDADLVRQERRFVAAKRRRLKKAYATASFSVAVSSGVRQALIEEFDVPAERVRTIPNPIDVDKIMERAQQPPAVFLAPDRTHIVGAGRLLEAKGLLELVEAMDELVHKRGLGQLQAHVLGEGPMRERLTAAIADRQLQDHVQLEGFQPNPYAIFARCQALCHPSHYEGMPNVLLEALACGLPVVATDCRWGPREILQDGKWGKLTPVGDAKALAAAIAQTVAKDSDVGATSARQYVEAQFSPHRATEQLQSLIVEAVELAARRP